VKSAQGLPRADLFFAVWGVTHKAAENRCWRQPADQFRCRLTEEVDSELAQQVQEKGCRFRLGGAPPGQLRAQTARRPRVALFLPGLPGVA